MAPWHMVWCPHAPTMVSLAMMSAMPWTWWLWLGCPLPGCPHALDMMSLTMVSLAPMSPMFRPWCHLQGCPHTLDMMSPSCGVSGQDVPML